MVGRAVTKGSKEPESAGRLAGEGLGTRTYAVPSAEDDQPLISRQEAEIVPADSGRTNSPQAISACRVAEFELGKGPLGQLHCFT